MTISDPGRGLVRRLGLAAAAVIAFTATSQQRAEALSLASPGTCRQRNRNRRNDDPGSRRTRPWWRRFSRWRWCAAAVFAAGGGSMAAASAAAARRFMAADLGAAVSPSMAEDFEPHPSRRARLPRRRLRLQRHPSRWISHSAALPAHRHFHHRHHFHRRSTRRPITLIRATTFIRAVTAGWSGPITGRARSAAIARGFATITGATACIYRYWWGRAETKQAPAGAPVS